MATSTNKQQFDSILIVAFGGPTSGEQSYDYVKGIVGDRPASEPRLREVASHYEALDGSPFNALTFEQTEALKEDLQRRGVGVPVYCGMRHWSPYVKDIMQEMAEAGLKETLAIIMAPHQCWVSWDWYQDTVQGGNDALGERALAVTYSDPWWREPGFIQANAERSRDAFARLGDRAAAAKLVFSAHSLPIGFCESCQSDKRQCPYSGQFEESARLVAEALGRGSDYLLCYQSQAGLSGAWLGPDVNELIRDCKGQGVSDVVVSPIGFLVDHVEVLWDLDVAAKKSCEECGIGYTRAPTVGTHPAFIKMLADRVVARIEGHPRVDAPLC